jgi:hypothetical protein
MISGKSGHVTDYMAARNGRSPEADIENATL